MANKRDLKRKIVSVQNTQKITKAMQLVAAAKFAKASVAVNSARYFSQEFDRIVTELIQIARELGINWSHPLMRTNASSGKSVIVVVSSDRGLCGSLNNQLFKYVQEWVAQRKTETHILPWGRKAVSWSKTRKAPKVDDAWYRLKVTDKPSLSLAKMLSADIVNLCLQEDFSELFIAFPKFKNALTQESTIQRLVPFVDSTDLLSSKAESKESLSEEKSVNLSAIVEPDVVTVLDSLAVKKLSSLLHQILLDAAASEHGSRMTAMDNASSNAAEVKKKFVLKYNRARQAAITKELIEIISGAEAL